MSESLRDSWKGDNPPFLFACWPCTKTVGCQPSLFPPFLADPKKGRSTSSQNSHFIPGIELRLCHPLSIFSDPFGSQSSPSLSMTRLALEPLNWNSFGKCSESEDWICWNSTNKHRNAFCLCRGEIWKFQQMRPSVLWRNNRKIEVFGSCCKSEK